MTRETVVPRNGWSRCIVAATGPSLTPEVSRACERAHARGWRLIAVNDAWRVLPFADALFAIDAAWWRKYAGVPVFKGERWSTEGHNGGDNKGFEQREFGLRVVTAKPGQRFSVDPEFINYGGNSTFAATNLAILFGAKRIVFVGLDLRIVDGQRHFFGDHPPGLSKRSTYANFVKFFVEAQKQLPPHIHIVNATPDSALRCFPMLPLNEALECRKLESSTVA